MSWEKNYKFSFNEDGFYTGLVRKNSLGLFPTNSTEYEPPWINGYSPIWNFEKKQWIIVKREFKKRIEYNIEGLKYFSDKELEKTKLLHNEIIDGLKWHVDNFSRLDREMFLYSQKLLSIEKRIVDNEMMIKDLLVYMVTIHQAVIDVRENQFINIVSKLWMKTKIRFFKMFRRF